MVQALAQPQVRARSPRPTNSGSRVGEAFEGGGPVMRAQGHVRVIAKEALTTIGSCATVSGSNSRY